MDLEDDMGESVEGWGTWAKPGSRSELQGEDVQAEIGRNKRLNRATVPRGNPSPMTSDDLPPCTFKEDLANMSGDDSAAYFEATTESLGLGEEDLKALRRPVLSFSPGSEAHRLKNSPALRCFSTSSRLHFSVSRSPSIFSTEVQMGNMST
jgi:hypothetical protein